VLQLDDYLKSDKIQKPMESRNYRRKFEALLINSFMPAGYKISRKVALDPTPESSKYEALVFALDEYEIVYRKGKVTPDRPGAFLAVWQRPSSLIDSNKPIPLKSNELDYMFVQVEEDSKGGSKYGMFIFPVSVLIEKGIRYTSH